MLLSVFIRRSDRAAGQPRVQLHVTGDTGRGLACCLERPGYVVRYSVSTLLPSLQPRSEVALLPSRQPRAP